MIRGINLVTPIERVPLNTISAFLMCKDANESRFIIGRIDYEVFNSDEYQYVLTPYWDVIDFLPKTVFSGIPGYDLREKKDKYYRVNFVPSFIKMRTPSINREDFNSLVNETGLENYERFAYLVKTNRISSFDNLELIECREPVLHEGELNENELNEVIYGDTVRLVNICRLDSSNAKLAYNLYRLLVSGANIYLEDENRELQAEERRSMLFLLKNMLMKYEDYFSARQSEGIAKAKEEGKFAGRKKKPVDPMLLHDVTLRFRSGKISEEEAMNILNIASRSTFYRRLKEVEEKG